MREVLRIHRLRMSLEQVELFQAFFMENCGLVFEGRRAEEMEAAIARRMIELGFSSFDEYYHYLQQSDRQAQEELSHLVITLTVGETQFFRTPDQFAALRKYVLPELISRERENRKELRILSAGCATGEEPYSLHILVRELIPDFEEWNISILACDLNREYLAAAREGIYGERKLRLVDDSTRERYFERLAKNRWRVKDFLKERITWKQFNLTSDDYSPLAAAGPFHLILCRNVLIYFKLDTIKKVVENLYRILVPKGYLMLGYPETLFKISDKFQSIHTPEAFFYIKDEKPQRPKPDIPHLPRPLEREEVIDFLGSRPHPWLQKEKQKPLQEVESLARLLGQEPKNGKSAAGPEPAELDSSWRTIQTRTSTAPPPPKEEPRQLTPQPSEDELWTEGLNLYSEERFEQARRVFERMHRAFPRSAKACLGLALLYANTGEEELSKEYASKAREYDDLLPEIYFLAALLEEKNGRLHDAVKNYQRVLLLNPDFAVARFNLGHLYLKLGKKRDAKREFNNTKRILESDPENHSLRFSGGVSREAIIRFCELQLEP